LKIIQTSFFVVRAVLRASSIDSITMPLATCRARELVRVLHAGTAKDASAAITVMLTKSSVRVRPFLLVL
jgi:hypothetical protein